MMIRFCCLISNCFAKTSYFQNGSQDCDDDERRNHSAVSSFISKIMKQNDHKNVSIVPITVDSWKQLLTARGDRLWSIRQEMLSKSAHSTQLSTLNRTLEGMVTQQQPIVLVIGCTQTFHRLENEYAMDKLETTYSTTSSQLSSTLSPSEAQRNCPLTSCTGDFWKSQRPKVQHGFRHIAERSRRCLFLHRSSHSRPTVPTIEDVIRREILDERDPCQPVFVSDTITTTLLVDLKATVHDTVCKWIVRIFCRSNSISLSSVEEKKLQMIESVFDCYWKSIRRPPVQTSSQETDSLRRIGKKNNVDNSSTQDSHRLELSTLLGELSFQLQEERRNENTPSQRQQYEPAEEQDADDDGEHLSSSKITTSSCSPPLPSPVLLDLALSFKIKNEDDIQTKRHGQQSGDNQSEIDSTVIANTINAMIAAADACQSLVFWTLWNLGRRRQLWTACRAEQQQQEQPVSAVKTSFDEQTQQDLSELAMLKQKATKGMKVDWRMSDHSSSSKLSMLGRAIMETVRYFPPVWTLPRIIQSSLHGGKKTKPIFVKLDVLTVNQAYNFENWNPTEVVGDNDHDDDNGIQLASFGLGRRHCPAGTASLQASYLICQNYLRRWQTLDEVVDDGIDTDIDSVGVDTSVQSSVYLGPTLCVEDGKWFKVLLPDTAMK